MKKRINEMKARLVANNYCAGIARGVISSFLAPYNCAIDELADIRCSVDEAVANCVIHAYKEPSDKNFVYISARLYDNREFSVEISDHGCGFDTARIGENKYEMGFIIMDSFMDSVVIKSEIGKGTTVRMTRRLTTNAILEEV